MRQQRKVLELTISTLGTQSFHTGSSKCANAEGGGVQTEDNINPWLSLYTKISKPWLRQSNRTPQRFLILKTEDENYIHYQNICIHTVTDSL